MLPLLDQLGQQLAAIGQEAVLAFQIGVTGSSFEQAVTRKHGEQTYYALAALGKQSMLAALCAHPAYTKHLAPRLAHIGAWLDDFRNYGAEENSAATGSAAQRAEWVGGGPTAARGFTMSSAAG